MLKIYWIPTAAGAPDSTDFQTAADYLRSAKNSPDSLQTFPKTVPFATGQTAAALAGYIDDWVAQKTRVVVMVHGYDYDPTGNVGSSGDDPFYLVYGIPGAQYGDPPVTVDPHNSWLPLVGEIKLDGTTGDDLAIAFAWVSEDHFAQYADACWSNAYQYAALDQAPLAAKALATVLAYLCSKKVPVDVFAHSLGTRLASQAIGLLEPGKDDAFIRRVILLGGAEYCVDANVNMFGRSFEVFNIASREDKVLTLGAEQMCHPVRANGSDAARVIGREGLIGNYRWLDIQLDRESSVSWLAGKGYRVSAFNENDIHPGAWLNHWAYYMNDGNRAFLGDLLNKPEMSISWFIQGGFLNGVDVPYYGHFNPQVPPTPRTAEERDALRDSGAQQGGGAA